MFNEKLQFMPLGAGSEVGRSCMYLKYKTTEILMDIGIHPAYNGPCSLPFLDNIDLTKIDALLVTHFHLDHAGALPYITERTNFTGKVYMTHPTKAILKYLLNDYTRLVNSATNKDFYTEKDLENCYNRIIAIDYHQEIVIKDFRVTALNAGHVLGAAMFIIKLKNNRILYTGDYSTEEDRHLKPAEAPGKLNTLIVESTYGVQCHLPRKERERRFTQSIRNILLRGGKVLLPVFALGRAQELLLILEEFWERNNDLKRIPIYYASALAKRCIGIYQTYSSSNKKVNFNFKYISNINYYEDSDKPCVVMASPGMLQSGLSRDLFERWCEDKRNGVIIAGYCVNGTLAKDIMNEPEEVISMKGGKLKLNCTVDYISFSAHVDFIQNSQFIGECDPDALFLVHGEINEMNRLKVALKRENIWCLRNCELHEIDIAKERILRGKDLQEGVVFEAIIKGQDDLLEVSEISKVRTITLRQKVFIDDEKVKKLLQDCSESNDGMKIETQINRLEIDSPENAKFVLIKNLLNEYYDDIRFENACLYIDDIKLTIEKDNRIYMEWKSNYKSDILASSISKIIKDIGSDVTSIKLSKLTWHGCLAKVLRNYYQNITVSDDQVIVKHLDESLVITKGSSEGSERLKEKVSHLVETVNAMFL